MELRECTKCHDNLPATLEYFLPHSSNKCGLSSWCSDCVNKNNRERRSNRKLMGLCIRCSARKSLKNRVLCKICAERQVIIGRASRLKLKIDVFEYYGGCVCKCCGEDEIKFLTLDHTNGGGNNHRKEIGNKGGYAMYLWVKKNNYPKGYRVLCMNCNLAIGAYGVCPHTTKTIN